MLTFCYLHTWCTPTLRNCVSFARGHMAYATPVMGWVGWGGDVDVLLPCTPGVRYATMFLLPVDTCAVTLQTCEIQSSFRFCENPKSSGFT